MPFDLVAEVRCFFGRDCASSKANFRTRSMPILRHHRLLHHDLALAAFEHPAADARVLALGVLAHDHHVDVARRQAGERRAHARHQARRAQVDVEVEVAPELEQRAPERDVIGNLLGPADGAEEDRIVAADLLLPVGRHHAAVALVVRPRREVEVVELQADAEAAGRRLEDAESLGNHFLADAVAGNDGDAMGLHVGLSFKSSSPRRRTTRATPTTVNAIPSIMSGVSDSPNIAHASNAVQGGTR